jgi:hypothetical protein
MANHIGKGIHPRVAGFLAVGQNAHLIGEYLEIVHDDLRMQEMTLAIA